MGLHKLTSFSGRRLTASMYSTDKQLNKILTAYDYLLILIDCASRGLLLAIAHGFLVLPVMTAKEESAVIFIVVQYLQR